MFTVNIVFSSSPVEWRTRHTPPLIQNFGPGILGTFFLYESLVLVANGPRSRHVPQDRGSVLFKGEDGVKINAIWCYLHGRYCVIARWLPAVAAAAAVGSWPCYHGCVGLCQGVAAHCYCDF